MQNRVVLSLIAVLVIPGAKPLAGQVPAASPSPVRQYETRAELEARAAEAERRGRSSEAWLLRSRLQQGDFQEGDRIVMEIQSTPRVDTLQVRAGKMLQIAGMADLPLAGVLRSELTETVRAHLAKYLRNPAVRVTPLIPISVLGSVGAPGYYYTSADVVLRDLIMRAGIPTTADINKAVIRRAGQTIWKAEDVRIALSEGLSLDRLNLRAGDEVFVPEARRFEVSTIISIVSATTAAVVLIIQILQR